MSIFVIGHQRIILTGVLSIEIIYTVKKASNRSFSDPIQVSVSIRQCWFLIDCVWTMKSRRSFGYGFGQWEEPLLCNAFSHWPRPYPEWSLKLLLLWCILYFFQFWIKLWKHFMFYIFFPLAVSLINEVSWIFVFSIYRQNIKRTKSQNLNVSRLVLQLSLPNTLKPRVKSRMKM